MFWEGMLYFFTSVGVLTITYYLFTFWLTIFNIALKGGKSLTVYGAGRGAWAVITGASDGIGKAFAFELAKNKFNVVILARTESKLQAISKEIQTKYNVETLVIPFDFSTLDSANYQSLFSKLSHLNITVLVNNVGASHAYPTPFIKEDPEIIQNLVNINVTSAMRMTHAIANQMKLSGSPGLILNLGSFAGLAPMPLLSVYGATKSFLYNWSQSIAHELKEDKIDVICLNTYYVVSEMSKIKKPSWMVPSAKSFVQSVLQNIGNEGGAGHAYTSSVYPSHAMMNWIISHVGTRRIWVKVFHMYLKLIREKALKKEKRMAESTLSTE